jgi:hypothetical protein
MVVPDRVAPESANEVVNARGVQERLKKKLREAVGRLSDTFSVSPPCHLPCGECIRLHLYSACSVPF